MENQCYVGRGGQIVTVRDANERHPAVRNGFRADATDYQFDITVDGTARRVRVAVVAEAIDGLNAWLGDSSNLQRIGRGGNAEDLAVDLCTIRILQAIDENIDFEQDSLTYPDSFLIVRGAPEPVAPFANASTNSTIREYIEQRLYAGWRACGDYLHCAQLFTRVDWLHAKVTSTQLRNVIDLHAGELWTEVVENQMYLKPTRSLIMALERAVMRTATLEPEPPHTQPALPSLVYQRRDHRTFGERPMRLIEREMHARGPLWKLVGFILTVVLALLALARGR